MKDLRFLLHLGLILLTGWSIKEFKANWWHALGFHQLYPSPWYGPYQILIFLKKVNQSKLVYILPFFLSSLEYRLRVNLKNRFLHKPFESMIHKINAKKKCQRLLFLLLHQSCAKFHYQDQELFELFIVLVLN